MVLLNQKILLLFREPPIMRAAGVTDDLRLSRAIVCFCLKSKTTEEKLWISITANYLIC